MLILQEGRTPLHIASRNGDKKMVVQLLAAGADAEASGLVSHLHSSMHDEHGNASSDRCDKMGVAFCSAHDTSSQKRHHMRIVARLSS
jgi:ankyrin repeat protein